jgi:hypothetical protein
VSESELTASLPPPRSVGARHAVSVVCKSRTGRLGSAALLAPANCIVGTEKAGAALPCAASTQCALQELQVTSPLGRLVAPTVRLQGTIAARESGVRGDETTYVAASTA